MAETLVEMARRVIARNTPATPFCAECGDRADSHPGGKCKYATCPCRGLVLRDLPEVTIAKAYLEAVGAN